MRILRRSSSQVARTPDVMKDRVDFAWRVHSALDNWTTKVDGKASIVLAIEAAALGLIVTLSSNDGPLAGLQGANALRFRWGIGFLALGTLLAGAAIFPQLSRWKARREWKTGIVYFGHLRRWQSETLLRRYENLEAETPLASLTKQHVIMAKIAWRKHVALQYSMLASLLGVALLWWSR